MPTTQSNKQIQNVKVIVNNNTAPPKRKPRRNPAPPPPPPDVQLPTPKMETWRMQSPYPAQPIQYSLPVTQIFPEKSVTPSYFEGHLTNMQNTLQDLREGFNQHVEELRNELLSRASTQQHAAQIERLVRDVAVQHENNLAGVEATSGNDAQQAPQQTPPFAPPQPNAQQQQQQALHDINDFEMYSNPLFGKDFGSPKAPQQAPQQAPPFAPPQTNAQQQQPTQQSPQNINDFEMYYNPLFNEELSSPKASQHSSPNMNDVRMYSNPLFGKDLSSPKAQHNSMFSNPLYDEDLGQQATMFSNSGESTGEPLVDSRNKSQEVGSFDKVAKEVEGLWKYYNKLNKGDKSRRLQRTRAIASSLGINSKGQMRTLVRRILARPL